MTDTGLAHGRYTILAELGRGGMATVHRARDEVLGRDVALKVLHPHLANDPAFRERFLREARAAAALSHPNVVAIHDLEADEHTARLVLEVVDGPTLSEVLATRGRMAPGEVLALLEPASLGLAAAHDAGLVHRDVKPGNILIDADGTVKVGDFGLARAAAASTNTFGEDMLAGSPHYVAPEAVNGAPLGPEADVYALGVVLFEMLTGRPPFQGDTPMATALQHTTSTVPNPSSVVPGVPPALDAVVQHATQRDPAARYPNAGAFAQALRAAVPSGPTPVDLRGGRHDTMVMPSVLTETSADGDATRVVLRSTAPTAGPARRRRSGRRIAMIVLLLLALAGGAGAATWNFAIAPWTDVPDLVGADRDVATAALEALGFEVEVAQQGVNSRDIPIGAVALVDPADRARRGDLVVLTPSLGPTEVVVPDVRNLDEPTATARLLDADFEVDLEFEHDDLVAQGFVIRTSPAAEGIALDGQVVTLFVSLGPAPVEIPGVIGMPLEQAMQALEDLGLTGTVVDEQFDESVPEGAIADQLPAAGTDGHRGDEVQLVVSKGGRPFKLPDVKRLDVDEARDTLEDLGLVVEVEMVPNSRDSRSGQVADTNPPKGTEVRRGDRIVLFVYE